MRFAVLGCTGSLGRALVDKAALGGHEVVALSRRAPPSLPEGVRHMAADVTTGHGLREGLDGADVVVDATNSVSDARTVLVEGTRRVIATARDAGVRHYVGISIVGIDDAPIAYYRVKVEQEKAIESGSLPWSLLRATQFHDLIARFGHGFAGVVVAPVGMSVQPIDVRDVAGALLGAADAGPAGRLADVAGPEVLRYRDVLSDWARAAGKRRLIIPVPVPGATGRFLRAGKLCNPERAVGTITFGAWLAETYSPERKR